jgi:hypothetical protein
MCACGIDGHHGIEARNQARGLPPGFGERRQVGDKAVIAGCSDLARRLANL